MRVVVLFAIILCALSVWAAEDLADWLMPRKQNACVVNWEEVQKTFPHLDLSSTAMPFDLCKSIP